MNLNDVLNGLSEQQKRRLAGARSKEELSALADLDAAQLSDGALSDVVGGEGGCFRPTAWRCWRCEQDNPLDARYCTKCGLDVDYVRYPYCPSCGTQYDRAESSGCPNCGLFGTGAIL